MNDTLDRIRESTLDRIEKNERTWRLLVFGTAVIELSGLVAFLLLMDFSDRLHLLILIAAVLVYWTLAGWTWALHVHGSANAQRILKSLELLHQRQDDAS